MAAFHPLRKFASQFSMTGVDRERSLTFADLKVSEGREVDIRSSRLNDASAPNLKNSIFDYEPKFAEPWA